MKAAESIVRGLRGALGILLAGCVALVCIEAEARKRESADAGVLLDSSAQALIEKRYADAYEAIVASYRAGPSPRALFQLGQLALAEGRQVAAHDLMRRFLAELPGAAPDEGPAIEVARRVLAEAPPVAGEVRLFGERGAQVFLDDKLVGTLPLTLPLLCQSGTRKIALESGKRRLLGKVAVRAGHLAEMRFNGETGAVLVTLPPSLLFVLDVPDPAAAQRITQAATDVFQAESYVVFRTELALTLASKPQSCLQEDSCLADVAERSGVTYALKLRARTTGAADATTWALGAAFLDPSIGLIGAASERSCAPCGPERAVATAAEMLKQLLVKGSSRPRGTLIVNSTPPGAEVREDGRLLGITPYKHGAYAGPHTLQLELAGFEPVSITVDLAGGQTATSEPVLKEFPEPAPAPLLLPPEPEPAPQMETRAPAGRLPRPRWRLGLGAAAMIAGSGLVALGVSAALSEGNCVDPSLAAEGTCRRLYQTAPVAAGLLPTGVSLILGGVVLLALPGARRAGVR